MSSVTRMAVGFLFVLFAVGTVGVSTAIAEQEVKMVFDIEGMR